MRDKRVHAFSKSINPKVQVITRLEFKLTMMSLSSISAITSWGPSLSPIQLTKPFFQQNFSLWRMFFMKKKKKVKDRHVQLIHKSQCFFFSPQFCNNFYKLVGFTACQPLSKYLKVWGGKAIILNNMQLYPGHLFLRWRVLHLCGRYSQNIQSPDKKLVQPRNYGPIFFF